MNDKYYTEQDVTENPADPFVALDLKHGWFSWIPEKYTEAQRWHASLREAAEFVLTECPSLPVVRCAPAASLSAFGGDVFAVRGEAAGVTRFVDASGIDLPSFMLDP